MVPIQVNEEGKMNEKKASLLRSMAKRGAPPPTRMAFYKRLKELYKATPRNRRQEFKVTE